jgi:hypothetical protein
MKGITKNEDKMYDVILEKSRLNREKSMLILNKALLLYFTFLFVGVIGFVYGYVESLWLNTLIIMGLIVLIIGILPYIRIIRDEERKLDKLLNELRE